MSTAARPARRRRPAPKRRRPTRRKKRNLLGYVGQLAAAATLVSTLVGLVFVFRPGCRPQDIGKAMISDIHVPRPMTFGRYLEEQNLSGGTMSREQLRHAGVIVTFHYEITGFRGKRLPLRWELNEDATGRLVDQDQALSIIPSTNDEGRDWNVWVPVPRTRRRYYISVTIYQPQKQLVPLKHFDTPAFRGVGAALR
jgi:hypothetical protein